MKNLAYANLFLAFTNGALAYHYQLWPYAAISALCLLSAVSWLLDPKHKEG